VIWIVLHHTLTQYKDTEWNVITLGIQVNLFSL